MLRIGYSGVQPSRILSLMNNNLLILAKHDNRGYHNSKPFGMMLRRSHNHHVGHIPVHEDSYHRHRKDRLMLLDPKYLLNLLQQVIYGYIQ